MKRDSIYECAFYGKGPDRMGCMYFRTAKTESQYPELYFFCHYTTRLLVMKKITLRTALDIQKKLKQGRELSGLMETWEQGMPGLEVTVSDYSGSWRYNFSASMMWKGEQPFRLGYIGFGFFFTNKKKLNLCAQLSVYGMVYTLYRMYHEDEAALQYLWESCRAMGGLELGDGLNTRNYSEAAKAVYQRVLGLADGGNEASGTP